MRQRKFECSKGWIVVITNETDVIQVHSSGLVTSGSDDRATTKDFFLDIEEEIRENRLHSQQAGRCGIRWPTEQIILKRRNEMRKQYYHRFKVSGTRHFPMDMLRYDGCWPSMSEDASKLSFFFEKDVNDDSFRSITLTSIGNKDWKPTTARWISFGWKVLETGIYSEVT